MSKQKLFDDGTIIEWIDKETLKYSKNEYDVLVWVDFEPGLFSNGRIIKASSINKWDKCPADSDAVINDEAKEEIIDKVKSYYESLNKKYRVE